MSDLHSETLLCFSLGSNLGDRLGLLDRAQTLLEKRCGRLVAVSPTYASAPWGFESPNDFYNRCFSIATRLKPGEVMDLALQTETALGRERKGEGYTDRHIDIDILLFGDRKIREADLTIPHPRMNERRFVLQALADIHPDLIHPVNGESILTLLGKCNDHSTLIRV